MAFLHQLFIAAQFTITQLSPCGVDILAKFLHLSQLDKFVASSHGTLHKQTMQMEAVINQFGDLEGKKLALKMPKKKITLCEDETFHPEICLGSRPKQLPILERFMSIQAWVLPYNSIAQETHQKQSSLRNLQNSINGIIY